MKEKLLNTIQLSLFILLSILYLEILFKTRVLTFAIDGDFFRIVLFSLAYTVMFVFVLKFFAVRTVRIATYGGIIFITLLYFNQEIYSSFVEGFYSVTVIGDFTAGLSFFSDYFTSFKFVHISYLLPIGALVLFHKTRVLRFQVEYCGLKQPLYFLLASFLFFFLSVQSISAEPEVRTETDVEITVDNVGALISYSDLDLYNYMYNAQDALKKFGLLTYTQRDFLRLFRTDPLTEEAYEILIDDYFENQISHSDNLYTGIFEDKNFILIMAESLDTFAINEVTTPTLYQLKTEHTYMENYYSPLYYRSTADSEFLVQTSHFPDKNVTLSMDAYLTNTFPHTLPKLFEEAGYSTYSFHNYFDYFYPRGTFHLENLGYDQFWGSEELGMTTGFDPERVIIDHTWESDLELMQRAIPKFINDEKFFVNLLTVSGHFQYSDDHEMAKPEYLALAQSYLDGLDTDVEYVDEILYYLAVHIELDRAIAHLIDELNAANKMDDTVIMIFGDHYAYGIDNEDIWAYDKEYKTDNDELDIHNVPMMIISDLSYLDDIEEYYMSTIDVMPTVANLFDLNLDYRLVFGNDAFSDNHNIVRFADGSFISADFRYESLSEQYTIYDDTISEEYLFALNNQYLNTYLYNILILEYDYYKEDDN